MTDDSLFIKQAVDALVSTSEDNDLINPTIRELLQRIKFDKPQHQKLQQFKRTNFVNDQTFTNEISPNNSIPSPTTFSMKNSNEIEEKLKYIIPDQTVVDPMHFSSLTSSISTPSLINGNVSRSNSSVTVNSTLSSYDTTSPAVSKKISDSENSVSYPCLKCDLAFLRSSDLRRHEKAHILTLPHICPRCGKGFARKDALKRHANTLTCDRNRKKLQEIAGNKFEEIIARAQKEGVSI